MFESIHSVGVDNTVFMVEQGELQLPALRGFAILYVFVFEVAVLQLLLRTLERTRPIFTAFAVNAVLSIFVAYPLVEAFGLIGAVAGMVGQQLLMAGLMFLSLGKILNNTMEEDSLAATRLLISVSSQPAALTRSQTHSPVLGSTAFSEPMWSS